MARKTTAFICSACGHQEPKWLGQCPGCGEWNTLTERSVSRSSAARPARSAAPGARQSQRLSEIDVGQTSRLSSGLGELDRALGGGLMPGSTVLIGGEPGIGKSTLMLQMAGSLRGAPVLYVSGEESASQISQRAGRLGLDGEELLLLCSSDLGELLDELEIVAPVLSSSTACRP